MVSDAYEVVRYGTDPNGRAIWMNKRMLAAYKAVLEGLPADLAAKLTIVQGAYMVRNGGGASESAGYHDRGGCLDSRTWNLTDAEQKLVIKVARSVGWAIWKRDQQHGGMDEHMHWCLLGDTDGAPGAKWQMSEYLADRDGLGTRGKDYHLRPDPIPIYKYDPTEDDDLSAEDVKAINTFTREQANRVIEATRTAEANTRRIIADQVADAVAAIPTPDGQTPAEFKAAVLAVVADKLKE